MPIGATYQVALSPLPKLTQASYLCGRNCISVVVKDMPGSVMRRHWRRILAAQLRYTFQSLWHVREKAARARLRGQFAALGQMRRMLQERHPIQEGRRSSDEHIEWILKKQVVMFDSARGGRAVSHR